MLDVFSSDERVLSVSQFNDLAKAVIENEPFFKGVCVTGEISGFKRYPSGHLYFSVKDEASALSCVMFRYAAGGLKFMPSDGVKVRIYGNPTIYVKDGRYQFMVTKMLPDGVGGLYAAFEQLKKKLEGEGLFDESKKKPLPPFPRRVGVITSIAGAALHDIISVTGRRFPCAELLVYPSAVQGEEAPEQLTAAVRWFSAHPVVDLLIIGRGGGSMEDLWAFNDEGLARALYACPVPTISAVGHETDFTICDFVCDRRAPTPSAAAEMAVPDRNELFSDLAEIEKRLKNAVDHEIARRKDRIASFASGALLRDPAASVRIKRELFEALSGRFAASSLRYVEKKRASLEAKSGKMLSLNPMAILARGYSAVFDDEGKVVRSAGDLAENDELTMRFSDGEAHAKVLKVSVDHG